MKKKATITTVSVAPAVDHHVIFQNKIGDIKMSVFAKMMFAASVVVFMAISTNSYSCAGGEGIGGRA